MRVVRVAVPVPALDSLTYSVPPDCDVPAVGARVLVPLGGRVLTGCVVEGADLDAPTGRIHQANHRDPGYEPFLPDDVVRLASWVAEYYACGVGVRRWLPRCRRWRRPLGLVKSLVASAPSASRA